MLHFHGKTRGATNAAAARQSLSNTCACVSASAFDGGVGGGRTQQKKRRSEISNHLLFTPPARPSLPLLPFSFQLRSYKRREGGRKEEKKVGHDQ